MTPELLIERVNVTTPAGSVLFHVPHARIGTGLTALTGPNGAGKSTFLRTIVGLGALNGGDIKLNDISLAHNRRGFLGRLVYQPQNFCSYPELTGMEFLTYFGRLRGYGRRAARERASFWLNAVGLPADRKRTGTYSQGMLQRLGLGYVLQSDASLCVLDEPFAGVDPDARERLSDLVAREAQNRVFIICTHHVDEMTNRGARVAHIDQGALWLGGAPH